MTTLLQRDQAVIWHPFTQHHTSPLPIAMQRGEGAYLFDQEGKRYLDLISSWWVNIHGHSHPQIAKAIYDQALVLEQVMFAGFTHTPAVTLAEKLLQLLPPGFSKVFYSDNGSTAVEVAIKMAYQYWRNQGEKQRKRFLAFSGGYHGDTFGAMSLGCSSKYYKHFADLLFAVDIAPFPATWSGDKDVIEKETAVLRWIDHYLSEHQAEVAAIIIEPLVQGASGMNMCRPQFLRALQELTQLHQVLIIYDEVMTAFGRTGATFACEKAGTSPDIICLAKGLTGGFLPLAATVCHERIYQAFLNNQIDHALIHGHSYTANPLGCAAALASLELLAAAETRKQLHEISLRHEKWLAQLALLPGIEKVRQCGTIAAFDLQAESSYGSLLSQEWRKSFQERGLILRPLGNVVYLLPPYCLSIADLDQAYLAIIDIIKNLTQVSKRAEKTPVKTADEWF